MKPEVFEIHKNDDDQNIKIYNEIYIYGELADDDLAQKIAADIENSWNEPQAKIHFGENDYEVIFEIKGFYIPQIDVREISNNIYPWKKYFKIVQDNPLNISFVDGLYSNTGQFLIKNIEKENSKTAAHEIGHNWGLKHPIDTDYRGKGQPHIMLPRGSFVDPQYRYTPSAELNFVGGKWEMDKGFTVDTDKRKVLALNIEDLRLQDLNYNDAGFANLSGLSNRVY